MAGIAARNISIFHKHTSMRLTTIEWEAINTICQKERIPRKTLFELIDMNHDKKMSLTGAIRLFTIVYYKNSYLGIPLSKTPDDFTHPIFEAIKSIT